MKISIVIPIWNGSEAIKSHLPKILEVARANSVSEVILSDDGSTDDSVEVIRKNFPEVILLERESNGGFSTNVNNGARRAKGDLLILLNIDTTPQKDFIKYALPHFEDPRVFGVGCNVGGLWATGRFEKGFFWHGQGSLDKGKKMEAHQTLWVSGGSGIFRKSLWDELGGLDTLFDPCYEEDVDLGYRATKRGYINIWEPKSIVEHYKEVGDIAKNMSKTSITRAAEKNHLIFIWKNITSSKLTREHQMMLVKILFTHPGYWPVFWDAWKNISQIQKKRKIEEREAKLTDEEVFRIFTES